LVVTGFLEKKMQLALFKDCKPMLLGGVPPADGSFNGCEILLQAMSGFCGIQSLVW
jgi:hypothetical protein